MTSSQNASAGPRTYLFALTDGGGTVPPELGVVRRLVDRGHRVTVLADKSMMEQVLGTGAGGALWTWKPAAEFRDWEPRSPFAMARTLIDYMITAPAQSQAQDVAAAITTTSPDRVVTSFFSLGAMIGAEAAGVPFDVLMPNIYPLPVEGRPPGGGGLRPMRGPMGRLRDRLAGTATASLVDRYALATVNAVRSEHGLQPVSHTWTQVHRARRHLILSSAAFDFPAVLPSNAVYVGPILDDPSWARKESRNPPAGANPLVLVAMSSTFQNQVACLQRIVDALGSLPVRGVVTTGPAVRPDAINAPPNVTVVASAPHRELMRDADLVITHGGHGTVMKSLASGVPLLVLHHGRDQIDNAARVKAKGVGISIPRTASAKRIARAASQLLGTDRYRLAARRLGERLNQDASDGALLDEIEG